MPSQGKNVAREEDVLIVVPSPMKVLQSGGIGHGLLKVAKGASKCTNLGAVHAWDGVPRSSED